MHSDGLGLTADSAPDGDAPTLPPPDRDAPTLPAPDGAAVVTSPADDGTAAGRGDTAVSDHAIERLASGAASEVRGVEPGRVRIKRLDAHRIDLGLHIALSADRSVGEVLDELYRHVAARLIELGSVQVAWIDFEITGFTTGRRVA